MLENNSEMSCSDMIFADFKGIRNTYMCVE